MIIVLKSTATQEEKAKLVNYQNSYNTLLEKKKEN